MGRSESGSVSAKIEWPIALTELFQSAISLERRREDESHILEQLRDELEALDAAIGEEFSVLTQRRPTGVPPSS